MASTLRKTVKPRRLDRSMKMTRARAAMRISSMDLREQPFGPHREDEEKCEMPGEHLPARVDVGADALRNAEQDPAAQRSPQAAETADDHGLEAEDQPRRPDRRIEIGTH